MTQLLPTQIPYFREIVIMNFHCEHCGYKDNQIQTLSALSPTTIRIELPIRVQKLYDEQSKTWSYQNAAEIHRDMNRQLIKTEFASLIVRHRRHHLSRCSACSLRRWSHPVMCAHSCTLSPQIPEIEFEMPPTKRGEINTVEGYISVAAENLQAGQEERMVC